MPPEPATTEEPGAAATEKKAPRTRARGCLFEIIETVLLTALIFLGIQTFVAQPYRVEGGSMEQTLEPDQYLLIDKLTPRWSQYERGDIVVLDPPAESAQGGTPFIKRIVGLPGDDVELRDGDVFVNDQKLDEPYVFMENGEPQRTEPNWTGQAAWLVPPGSVFVLGDHRDSSSDSRSFGPVEVAHVLGRAWLRYWPIDAFGVLPEVPAAVAADGT